MKMEQLIAVGFIFILIGIFLIIIGSILSSGKGETKIAVGGFIGPVPFGFANEKNMLYLVMFISLIMFILFLFLFMHQKII